MAHDFRMIKIILKRDPKNLSEYCNGIFPTYEFHIAKELRKKYEIENELFISNGNVVFVNNHAVRLFVQKLNSKRAIDTHVRIGEVNAIGLLDEIYHFLLREYELSENPGVFKKAYDHLNNKIGENDFRKLLFDFISIFPPMDVYHGHVSAYDYLNSYTEGRANLEITIEEMLLLYFSNVNPGAQKLRELFSDGYFSNRKLYDKFILELDKFFQNEKKFGPDSQDIFTFLRTPIISSPDDLYGQLEFIRTKWKVLIESKFLKRLLISKDLMKEDIVFESAGGGGGGAPTIVPKYKGKADEAEVLSIGKSMYKYGKDAYLDYEESEQFTPDTNWMPRVVLIAKNTYVWLDQLSKKYGRHIHRLDQVPDEELDEMARWNFNGLWLIGIWERSNASKKIKHILGNVDAVASAYSLYDYQIAQNIGGEEAYDDLNKRAKIRGIRLASDMVPNHTGIYSKWVSENPDYFIQSKFSPFPNYKFGGENLSEDPNYQVRIEDGYWNRTDAAVVFQRIDNNTGDVRYIYHGNDGTNMPWNDTAQLDLLKKEVRQAVIDKIFEVARKFSIIRFDAAMTLTKKHFSRLWYPQPGMGGDIPSRTDYALTREEFDNFFPVEFWREVVDKINEEMPETLLLAEAFWLMEGYFVRSLGMHRVYNSAFMHMMMKEENEKYRDLITNTLEFEPEILKRYVNFMSNPDEETAIKQFGTGDKYFGVCMMMITLPGLPMFAHGQIQGFTEKYGMEYQRAYYNETPNAQLIERHERELFPLMKKRYLFSNVIDFWFYDVIDEFGNINENVFAYTNEYGNEKAFVLYNNKFERVEGRIYHSTPKLVGDKKLPETISLKDALGIKDEKNHYYIFRESSTRLEYIRTAAEFSQDGYPVALNGFEYKIFVDFREVYDSDGKYKQVADILNGEGVPSVERKLMEIELEPIHKAFEKLFDEKSLSIFIDNFILESEEKDETDDEKFLKNKFHYFLNTIETHFNLRLELNHSVSEFENWLGAVKLMNEKLREGCFYDKKVIFTTLNKAVMITAETNYFENSLLILIHQVLHRVENLFEGADEKFKRISEKLLLDDPIKRVLKRLGRSDEDIYKEFTILNILLDYDTALFNLTEEEKVLFDKKTQVNIPEFVAKRRKKDLQKLFEDDYVKAFLGVNFYDGIWYFSKENFDELFNWLFTLSIVSLFYNKSKDADSSVKKSFLIYNHIINQSHSSGYKWEELKDHLFKIDVDAEEPSKGETLGSEEVKKGKSSSANKKTVKKKVTKKNKSNKASVEKNKSTKKKPADKKKGDE
ncbi:MAG: hypothetical protein K9J16_11840 [Melioribacteraceae bacterium]|nr:hypothetical protein [Melioribacteraceae bacterium]MCF8357082.1 hypothetical protein [Melioribacteraceae bacterium]MCF8394524.1 hypothetical protein [Melioribacteraceae bacterium]MCF8420140.1 hypothetical protein [Melioribacteraceae bacterium]